MPHSAITLAPVVESWSVARFAFTRTLHDAGTRYAKHAHGVASLQIVVRGSVEETVERRRYAMKPGTALFKPAGAAHSNVYRDDAECLLIEVPESLALDGVVAERTGRAWAFNLLRECRTREPGWQLVVEGLTVEALGHLARERWRAESRPAWLDDVVDLARAVRTLADIATQVGRHASHIAREFRRHEGVSVGEYARRCRLELAATALRERSDSIVAVALAAGFCDQSHFTNAFRRLFGVTPAEYRRVSCTPVCRQGERNGTLQEHPQ